MKISEQLLVVWQQYRRAALVYICAGLLFAAIVVGAAC